MNCFCVICNKKTFKKMYETTMMSYSDTRRASLYTTFFLICIVHLKVNKISRCECNNSAGFNASAL